MKKDNESKDDSDDDDDDEEEGESNKANNKDNKEEILKIASGVYAMKFLITDTSMKKLKQKYKKIIQKDQKQETISEKTTPK